MHLTAGCTSKCLVRVGGGNLKSTLALVTAAVVAAALIHGRAYEHFLYPIFNPVTFDGAGLGLASQRLQDLLSAISEEPARWLKLVLYGLLILIVSVWSLSMYRSSHRKIAFIGGTVVGLAVIAGWWISAGPIGARWIEDAEFNWDPGPGIGVQSYTFVNPLADAFQMVTSGEWRHWATFALVGAAGVIAGSFVYHLIRRRLRFEMFTGWGDLVRHLLGGALLGGGGVLALGCTIGQGVTGISTLALGSFLATVATMLGAALAIRTEYYRLVYEGEAGIFRALGAALTDLKLWPERWRPLERV